MIKTFFIIITGAVGYVIHLDHYNLFLSLLILGLVGVDWLC